MKKYLLHIGLLILFGIPAAYGQDIEVRATVNETTIGAQEQLIFSVEVAGAGFSGVETPSPPEAEGLSLLQSTPSVHRNMTFANGALEQSVTFRWSYRPLQEGPARLLATSVTVDGQTWETQALEIVVVDQAQRPQQQQPQASNWPFGAPSPTWPQGNSDSNAPAVLEPNDLFIRAVPVQPQHTRTNKSSSSTCCISGTASNCVTAALQVPGTPRGSGARNST